MTTFDDHGRSCRRSKLEQIRSIMGEAEPAAPRTRQRSSTTKPASITVSARDGVAIGNNNIITIVRAERVVEKTEARVHPGSEHITDAQAARIQELVARVVAVEAERGSGRSYGAVYSALFKHLGGGRKLVPQYRLIPVELFGKAEAYLLQWVGRLDSGTKKVQHGDDWRKRQYSFIFTNAKKLGAEERLRDHCNIKFGTESLRDLSDADLRSVYMTVSSWKRSGNK